MYNLDVDIIKVAIGNKNKTDQKARYLTSFLKKITA